MDVIGEYIIWCFREENFNIFIQLIFPFIAGTIGGWASYAIMKRDGESFDPKKLEGSKSLHVWLGGLAGFLAVNLLNPSGNIGQVLVLGFVAGLSGVTYLKRNALVESLEEKRMFGKEKSKLIQTVRNLNQGEVPTPDIDNEEEESLLREIDAEDDFSNDVLKRECEPKANDLKCDEQPDDGETKSSEQSEEQTENDELKANDLKPREQPDDKKEKIMN